MLKLLGRYSASSFCLLDAYQKTTTVLFWFVFAKLFMFL